MDSISRKRHSTDSSLEPPGTKKKKKLSKTKRTAHITPVSPIAEVVKLSKKPLLGEKLNGSPKKASHIRDHSDTTFSSGTEESRPGASATDPSLKPRKYRKPRMFYSRPINGSWVPHVGSLLMYRCVSQALIQSVDPRTADEAFDWSTLASGVVSAKDLELIWTLIKNEYPGKTLEQIKDQLKPWSSLTVEEIKISSVKDKFKADLPKMPVTAYMLFVQSKSAAVKTKNPKISQTELAKKLGKKWRSLSAEQKEVYKQQYQKLKNEYDLKLEAFYEEHPDAKKQAKKSKESLTPELKRIRELKAAMPSAPPLPYAMFCKAKRQKAQEKHPELSSREITKKLSVKWKSMSEAEKAKYKTYCEEAKKTYKQKLKLFHETYPDAKELLPKSKKALDAVTKTEMSSREEDSDSCWDTDVSVTEEHPVKPPPAPSLSPEKLNEESNDSADSSAEDSDSSTDLED